MAWHNWFIPHKQTHQKAHLLSWEGLLIYVFLFILLQVGFSVVGYTKPGVLGISSSIDQKSIIELTNKEREKKGLAPVVENEALDKAAALKAQNMFSENYWAHFAPSGKTPWDFIIGAGYHFTFAGENLAKNFYKSDEVVSAWMNSQTHRDNLLNSHYKDIGIAVVEGVLNGQKTTLVVQEFATTENITSKPVADVQGKEIEVPTSDFNKPQLLGVLPTQIAVKSLVDPYQITKYASLSVILFMGILLVLDLYVLYKRKVFRISSRHFAHMSLLSISAASILFSTPGSIL